jgi:hypothetical protein
MLTTNLRFLAVLLALGVALLFLGNSNGPAANGNFYTGAPSAGGGTESTCSTCHRSGNFGEPVINVTFSEGGSSVALTEYVPGQTYTVTVAVGYGGNEPSAFGFSSQFLNLATSPATTAGTLANPSSDARITRAGNGRNYAEHRMRGQDGLFTFEWTAPQAGAGAVNYYVTGVLANSAGGTSGDNGSTAPTIITLAEGTPSNTRYLTSIPHALFPNPTSGAASLRVTPPLAGNYRLEVIGIDSRLIRSQSFRLSAGVTELAVPSEGLSPGVYAVQLIGEGSRLVTRLVVR